MPAIAPPRAVVPHTSAVPNYDTMAQTPLPAVTRPPGYDPTADGPPTIRVPVHRTPARIPVPPHPHPLATTPAPVADLSFSYAQWSNDGECETPDSRRAPRVGDSIYGFKLVNELGRGAFARVYLAEQESLANRPVALKVTLRPTREAERLARLQHTNIVPVYSVHDEGSVQVICMPFLGRVTIAELIRAYRADPTGRKSGRKSTSARAARSTEFDSKQKPHSKFGSDSKSGRFSTPRQSTWTWTSEGPPPIVGDPVAVLQALAQLAAGLGHAHERGILHLDLKPANVLLADTGEPMLLDFNLSFDASNPNRELVGGTMPYMAIEQLLDMRNRGKSEIDQRADLYSLGVMAFEMLTGLVLFPTSSKGMRDIDALIAARRKGPPSIRELNPEVTPAVEAIVRKLLAAEPADRYQTADDLREDIDRHLNDQPLKYAREASLRERFGKWRRRNPRLPLKLAVAFLILSAMGFGGLAYDRAKGQAQAEEKTAKLAATKQAEGTHAALDPIRLDLILPNDSKSRDRGVKTATELLAMYGLPDDADWRNRPEVRQLSEEDRAALVADLGELMALLAHAKWYEAESRPEPERRVLIADAWKLNAAARACFSEQTVPPFLNQQTATLAPAAGETFTPAAGERKPPANARDHFLDGVSLLSRGRYEDAIVPFDRVTVAHPNHAAAHFCLAFCRHQMGTNYDAALERYDVARVMLPKDPRPSYQRGLLYGLRNDPVRAEEEFTKALALDPAHVDSLRHRAVARYRVALISAGNGDQEASARKLVEAETDLTIALGRGAPPMFVFFVRSEVRDARGNRAGADADRKATEGVVLATEEDFLARGWSRLERDPKAATEDFLKALALNPRSIVALRNLSYLYTNKWKDDGKALAVFDRLVEMYPDSAPGIAGRGVVLARMGRREESHKEIARARVKSNDAEILYLAASVYSLTSKSNPEDHAKAVALVREALNKKYANLRGMQTDPNLDPIREDAEFQEIYRAATALQVPRPARPPSDFSLLQEVARVATLPK